MHDDTIEQPIRTIEGDWDSLTSHIAKEVIEMVWHNHGLGDDDNEKCYYNAHQMLMGRDFGKLILAKISEHLGVGV